MNQPVTIKPEQKEPLKQRVKAALVKAEHATEETADAVAEVAVTAVFAGAMGDH